MDAFKQYEAEKFSKKKSESTQMKAYNAIAAGNDNYGGR